MSQASDFHKKNNELKKATEIQVGEIWVQVKFDSFPTFDKKVIELLFNEEVPNGTFTKQETETLIKALQKLLKEL